MPGYCYNTHIVYEGRLQPPSSITLQQRKVNEKWIENTFLKSKRWIWKDEMMFYTKDGNKITCNREAYNKLALIVSNKWLNKNIKVIN